MFSYARREVAGTARDPIRLTLALLGSVILMFVMGYGINLDVEDLTFAVLDRDQTTTSRDYVLDIAGSRYFVERPPIADYDESRPAHARGELSLAIEIPPGFAPRSSRVAGRSQIGAWIDGAMPQRAETVRGYVQGMHAHWLAEKVAHGRRRDRAAAGLFGIETRFRYNPDVTEPGGDGAGGDPAAADADPGHAGGAERGAREGAGLDRQFLRHADHPAGVPARQAAPLCRAGNAELPAADGCLRCSSSACR